MRHIYLVIAIVFFYTSGCVTSGKYKALQKDLEQYKQKWEKSEKDKEQLLGSISEVKEALEDLKKRNEEARKRIDEYKDLFWKLKALIDDGKLRLKLIDGRMVVVLPSDVLFPTGAFQLSPAGIAAIKEITPVLVSLGDKKFQVEGHTDNIPIKTYMHPSNWELAADRALNVLHAMVQAGMPPERVSATSYGDSRPLQPNNTIAGQMANRRIEIVIVPDLTGLPGYKELKEMTERREKVHKVLTEDQNEKQEDAGVERDNP